MFEAVSFLRSEGHCEAGDYPLWKVHYEQEIARRRVNQNIKSNTVLMAVAVASHKGKKPYKAFQNALEKIDG